MSLQIRVWDLPTRLFHWLLAAGVAGALTSGWIGGNWMVWHGRLGLAVAGLLGFRLAWGLCGSTYARFAQLLQLPRSLPAYLRGEWHGAGHNPLGWLSVLAMLGVLTFQVASGLLGSDDIAFVGPLSRLVDSATSELLTGLHRKAVWLVVALIALHLAALLFYRLARGENLVPAMLTGKRRLADASHARPASGGGPLALLLALAIAGAVVWAADGAWIPLPPPAESAPAW